MYVIGNDDVTFSYDDETYSYDDVVHMYVIGNDAVEGGVCVSTCTHVCLCVSTCTCIQHLLVSHGVDNAQCRQDRHTKIGYT